MPKIIATKEDWLNLGLICFAEEGLRALNVEKMAVTLNCNKSSFYWYFKNRTVFINNLLDHWVHVGTDEFMIEAGGTPAQELERLLRLIFKDKRGRDFIFFLRQFACNNQRAKKILTQTEQVRMNHLASLLERMGLEIQLANDLSIMLYHNYLGWYERHKYTEPSDKEVEDQLRLIKKCFQLPLSTTE